MRQLEYSGLDGALAGRGVCSCSAEWQTSMLVFRAPTREGGAQREGETEKEEEVLGFSPPPSTPSSVGCVLQAPVMSSCSVWRWWSVCD